LAHPNDHPLVKQIHDCEREIDAIESRIQAADLKRTYPHEYSAMRLEQEVHRQDILKCKKEIDDPVPEANKTA
jgi:hypothetical protein